MKKTNIILSEKSWNQTLIKDLSSVQKSFNWINIKEKSKFTIQFLKQFNIEKIFIPHWSYLITKDIYEKYECIVFHMTDLPFGRGGSPLQNLITRGIYDTKISALKVEKGIDTGDVYLKKDFNLSGSATEIFKRGNLIIKEMIIKILQDNIKPLPQKGEVTIFKRRKPEDSNMGDLKELTEIYDYIRMLDADGYPKAFIENKYFKFEFSKASIEASGEINCKTRIIKKQ